MSRQGSQGHHTQRTSGTIMRSLAVGASVAAVLLGSIAMIVEGSPRPPRLIGTGDDTRSRSPQASITQTAVHATSESEQGAQPASMPAPRLQPVPSHSSTGSPNRAPGTANAPAKAKAMAEKCTTCHDVQSASTHPVGIVPSMSVPSQLPLENGRVSCTTCHDPQAAAGHATKRGSGKMFIRDEDRAAALCTQCHVPGSTGSSPHASARLKAHSGSPERAAHSPAESTKMTDARTGRTSESTDRPDAQSRSCMACHDGTMAGDAGAHAMPRMDTRLSTEHPIGVRYQSRSGGDAEPIALKPKGSLDHRVRLFNDRIGCGTCHDVYGGEKRLLVMNNLNSRLCLSCHEL